jgi:SAM-dependent methyltransferase
VAWATLILPPKTEWDKIIRMARGAAWQEPTGGKIHMTTNRHFDWLAPYYDRLIHPPADTGRLRSTLDLPAAGWVLDAAGGTGRVARVLCPLVERLAVCDLSLPMLRNTRADGCLHASHGRVEHLPFPDGQFSRILVVDAFHHFGDQPGAIHELARVLAPGGRLVIQEPDIRRFAVRLIALAETLALMGSRFLPPQAMCAMLAGEGLRAWVETEGPTAWIIAEKEPVINGNSLQQEFSPRQTME